MVLADLVVDIADAGVGDCPLGKFTVAARLDDGPARGADEFVDTRLVEMVSDALRRAGLGDQIGHQGEHRVVGRGLGGAGARTHVNPP